MRIELHHLSRIEGHANLVVDAGSGEVLVCRFEVVESPRFFEPLLVGRHYSDVAPIVARICGVCSNSHTLASLAATEEALGIRVSEQTQALRRLLAYGEILQSHLLHAYFMAAPDYLGLESVFPLVRSRREVVARALAMKKVGNDICRTVGGRPVHPVTPCVGGFASVPEARELQGLRRQLVEILPDLEATVELFAEFAIPEYARRSEYLCLDDPAGYPLFGENVVSSLGGSTAVEAFDRMVEEYAVPHSTAKFARTHRGPYLVGPLARINNAVDRLSPMARKVAAAVGLTAPTHNPYRNVLARLVEVVHVAEAAIHLVDDILAAGLRAEAPPTPCGWGRGVAAVEAPRGLLVHAYDYDADGRVTAADCLIPTAQNLANLEADLRDLVPGLIVLPRAELTARLEKLLRAYDPCISCSTHLLTVDFA